MIQITARKGSVTRYEHTESKLEAAEIKRDFQQAGWKVTVKQVPVLESAF